MKNKQRKGRQCERRINIGFSRVRFDKEEITVVLTLKTELRVGVNVLYYRAF